MSKRAKSFPLEHPFSEFRGYNQFLAGSGRWHIYMWNPETNKRRLITRARYNMCVKLGRILEPHEHVDHDDEDKTNDDIGNLKILTVPENNRKHVWKKGKTAVPLDLTCPTCKTVFQKSKSQVGFKLAKGQTIYCSHSCATTARWERQHASIAQR